MTSKLLGEIGTASTQENTTGKTYQRNTIFTVRWNWTRGKKQKYIVTTTIKTNQNSTNSTPQQSQSLFHRIT
jgi:hypothetical protein